LLIIFCFFVPLPLIYKAKTCNLLAIMPAPNSLTHARWPASFEVVKSLLKKQTSRFLEHLLPKRLSSSQELIGHVPLSCRRRYIQLWGGNPTWVPNCRNASLGKRQPACLWQATRYQGGNLRNPPQTPTTVILTNQQRLSSPHPLELASSAPRHADSNH